MVSRRNFIGLSGTMLGIAAGAPDFILAASNRRAQALAPNDVFWFQVRQAFNVDGHYLALNAGANNTMARPVLEAWHQYTDFTNLAPLTNRQVLGAQREAVRARLATLVRRSPEEIALTRNTTEGLNIVIGGLRLAAGDEIVATTHEYPVTMNALRQRVARDGLQLRLVALPIAPDSPRAVVETVRDNLSARTRLLVTPHIVDPTGQLLPIRALADAARARGALYLVDGALGFGTVDVNLSEVDCDFYATSLHKGLHGPLGTGFLFVKQSQIQPLWPLFAAQEPEGTDIRKLESVGTQPFAQIAALTQTIDFHVAIGIGRLQARLHWLKRYWTDQVRSLPGIRFHTSLDEEQSAAIVLMEMERIEPRALYEHLLARDRIRAWPIVLADVRGLWVAPFPYTLPHELDRLVSAIQRIVRSGLG